MNLCRFLGVIIGLVASVARAEEPLGSDYRIRASGILYWMDDADSPDARRDAKIQLRLILGDRLQTPEHLYLAASAYSYFILNENWPEIRALCKTYPPRSDDFEYQLHCLRAKELPIAEVARQIEDLAEQAQRTFPNRIIASDIMASGANLLNFNGFLMESVRLYKKSFELIPAHAVEDILYSKLILAHAMAHPFLSPESQRQAMVYFDEVRQAYRNLPPDSNTETHIRIVAYEKAIVHLFLFNEYADAIRELDNSEGYQRLGADIRVFKAYALAKNQQGEAARRTLKSIDWSLSTDPERLAFLQCYVEITKRILGDDVSVRNCVDLKSPQLDVLLDLTSTVARYPLRPAEENAIWRNFYQFFDKKLKPDVQRSLSLAVAEAEVQQGKAEVRLKDLQIKNLTLFRQFTFALAGTALILVALVLLALRFWYRSRLHAQDMSAERLRLQNILNNIEEGIIKIMPGLTLVPEDSQHLKWLLGTSEVSSLSMQKLLEIFALPPDQLELVRECLNAVLGEEKLAWEMNASNLPADIRIEDRDIACFWQPIIEQGHVQAVLLVLHDRTMVKALERESNKAREESDALIIYTREIMTGHPKMAQQFIQDLPQNLQSIREQLNPGGDRKLALRLAHTLKGNARSLRLLHMQDSVHSLESIIQERSQLDLTQTLDELLKQAVLYQTAARHLMTTGGSELIGIVDVVATCRITVLDMLKKADIAFAGLCIQERLVLNADEVKILQEIILHGLTNAVDHGFILPKQAGQSPQAALFEIELAEHEGYRQLLIRDNGCGIPHASLQQLAASRGWSPRADQLWTDFLFLDGVSTSDAVSVTSGRGVGLAAIRSAAEQLSGRVRLLDNDRGSGALLKLTWPPLGQPIQKAG